MTGRKTAGVVLVSMPAIVPITMVAYALANIYFQAAAPPPGAMVAGHAAASSGELSSLIGNIVNVGLSLIGLIGVLSLFTALPIGIYLLASEEDKEAEKQAEKKV